MSGTTTKALGGAMMTKMIPLTQGKFASVDDEDYEVLSRWKWYAYRRPEEEIYYAARNDWSSGKKKTIWMHREIMKTPKNQNCDHIHHDTLDNRKSQLRNCTPSQSSMNRRKTNKNTSGYKGVFRNGNNWRVQIKKDGELVVNKTFVKIIDAARAYDKFASEYFGEYASLNFKE